jgi:hypothetical protein
MDLDGRVEDLARDSIDRWIDVLKAKRQGHLARGCAAGLYDSPGVAPS